MTSQNKSKARSLKELKKEGWKVNKEENHEFIIEDIYENCTNSKLASKLKTGIVFDDLFTAHSCIWDPSYPENPKRYTCIIERLNKYGLIDRCERIDNRDVSRDEICKLHDPKQVDIMESTRTMTDVDALETLASQYDSVYFNEKTQEAALRSAGSVLNLVESVATGRVQNGMAVVRPPGHHAMQDNFCGYCFYNNVALAARHVLDNCNMKRVLIVDWDVHHGQATQQMFYDDPRVLYFSIHRYEQGEFWPNLRESNFDYCGKGDGFGYNINIPLNETGCGDADYLTIFHTVLLPIAYEFDPEIILVSAGYDAAIGCTEGEMVVSPGCYHHLTTTLMGLARGKVAVCLEGGYFLPSLAEGAAQTLKALLGEPAPGLDTLLPVKPSVFTSIYNVISILRSKWKCLNHFNEESDVKKHLVEIIYKGYELNPPFETRSCYPHHTEELQAKYRDEVKRLQNKYYEIDRVKTIAYVYNDFMELHKSPDGNSFERPERISRCIKILEDLLLLDRLESINSREATDEEICSCHEIDYMRKIEQLGSENEISIKSKEGWKNVFTSPETFSCARMAAGSLLELVQAVTSGRVAAGVAIVRPPGHHAETDSAGGFCLFNNVAIAAHYALNKQIASRILILDWDIHHGNGIQHMFYDNPNVLYMSVHRYDNGRFFPNSSDADASCTGSGAGTGYNVNVTWNDSVMSDAEYIAVWTRMILPVAYQFNPDLVLVAAGFDACRGDPIGGYSVSPEAYGHLVQLLKPLAAGRIILALEGGYNVNSVAYSMAMCVKALLSDPLPPLKCNQVVQSASSSIQQTINFHQKQWHLLLKPVSF